MGFSYRIFSNYIQFLNQYFFGSHNQKNISNDKVNVVYSPQIIIVKPSQVTNLYHHIYYNKYS